MMQIQHMLMQIQHMLNLLGIFFKLKNIIIAFTQAHHARSLLAAGYEVQLS